MSALALFLSGDREFKLAATVLRAKTGSEVQLGISQIRERLRLPGVDWVYSYLGELVRYFDDRSRVRTLVSNWRPAYEFPVGSEAEGALLVDPEGSSRWVAYGSTRGEAAVSTLNGLESRSSTPRAARRWWQRWGLPKRRQPTESLLRDTYLYFLVCWRGLTWHQAAGAVADLADEGRIQGRIRRGNKKLPDGTRALHDEILSDRAVRKAVRRIEDLLHDSGVGLRSSHGGTFHP